MRNAIKYQGNLRSTKFLKMENIYTTILWNITDLSCNNLMAW